MILFCKELEDKLDSLWYQLQQIIAIQSGAISQIDLDTACINWLEDMIANQAQAPISELTEDEEDEEEE
jgi:hypothetical protein